MVFSHSQTNIRPILLMSALCGRCRPSAPHLNTREPRLTFLNLERVHNSFVKVAIFKNCISLMLAQLHQLEANSGLADCKQRKGNLEVVFAMAKKLVICTGQVATGGSLLVAILCWQEQLLSAVQCQSKQISQVGFPEDPVILSHRLTEVCLLRDLYQICWTQPTIYPLDLLSKVASQIAHTGSRRSRWIWSSPSVIALRPLVASSAHKTERLVASVFTICLLCAYAFASMLLLVWCRIALELDNEFARQVCLLVHKRVVRARGRKNAKRSARRESHAMADAYAAFLPETPEDGVLLAQKLALERTLMLLRSQV